MWLLPTAVNAPGMVHPVYKGLSMKRGWAQRVHGPEHHGGSMPDAQAG